VASAHRVLARAWHQQHGAVAAIRAQEWTQGQKNSGQNWTPLQPQKHLAYASGSSLKSTNFLGFFSPTMCISLHHETQNSSSKISTKNNCQRNECTAKQSAKLEKGSTRGPDLNL
jgi:hypothetical protein